MTVQLSEGCWGVTRGGEKRGPGVANRLQGNDKYPWNMPCPSMAFQAYSSDGTFCLTSRVDDIIAVFPTEADADAYLAGPAEEPKLPEVGSSFDFLRQDGTWSKVRLVPDAPKPVTWPDGVGTIELFGGDTVTVAGGYVVINQGLLSLKSAKARHLAALLLAAADKVEGRG